MLFNSLEYLFFLPIVFIIYWALAKVGLSIQNIFVLSISYLFYGWWDWRFLFLIAFSSILDFFIAKGMLAVKTRRLKKNLLLLSFLVNLGMLGFFKYYNFFLESFFSAFPFLMNAKTDYTLNIILPVGISFYTFQTLSYTIDVYRGKIKPIDDLIAFASFVSFFPQLVAGPIERAVKLLPQFQQPRIFSYNNTVNGMKQILWGLFKKMVIADNCAEFVSFIFNGSATYSGSTLMLGAVLFSFQIYADFSGYSDIAIGTANLFGFRLTKNFSFPYFSTNLGDFWKRWHISLFNWFRDYVYIPLGGNQRGIWKRLINVFVVFFLSGLWHGANWTFILWGLLNACFLIPNVLFSAWNIDRGVESVSHSIIRKILGGAFTFIFVSLAWIMFRSENVNEAIVNYRVVFSESLLAWPYFPEWRRAFFLFFLLLFFMGIEWFGRKGEYAIEKISDKWPRSLRWMFLAFIFFLIGVYAHTEETPFIYFQF